MVDFLASLSASVPKRRFGWVDLPERNGRRAIVVVTRSWFGLLPDSHRTQSGWLTHFHRLFLEIRHVLGDISLTQAGGRGQGADVSPFKPFSPSRVQVREVIAGRVCCVVMTASLCLVNVCDTNRYMDVLYDRVSLSRSDLDPCLSPSTSHFPVTPKQRSQQVKRKVRLPGVPYTPTPALKVFHLLIACVRACACVAMAVHACLGDYYLAKPTHPSSVFPGTSHQPGKRPVTQMETRMGGGGGAKGTRVVVAGHWLIGSDAEASALRSVR